MSGKRGRRRRGGGRPPALPVGHPEHPLEAYRELIDDWDALIESIQRPEPTILRANTVRITPEALAERLARQGWETRSVPGLPHFLQVTSAGPGPVSDSLEHWLGLFYMQQSATGIAAGLLGARPGERVLDLCAAPGGKTTHLAELMKGEGSVVCADVNEGRIRALLGNIYRLGHTNIMVVAGDSRTFPTGPVFDRVMVDVPCSAQGTLRKRKGQLPRQSGGWEKQITKAQRKILERAIRLTRPGGTLLYVTCTFDPIENEAVLTRVLQDAPVDVDPIELDVPHARGVTRFGDEVYDERMTGAVRLYPHHLDSGGLFICRLVKSEDAPVHEDDVLPEGDDGWRPVPRAFPGEDFDAEDVAVNVADGLRVLDEQLGIQAAEVDVDWMRRGTNLWAHRLKEWPVEVWSPARWRVVAVGYRGIDVAAVVPRQTNDLVLGLADRIRDRIVDLGPARWMELLEGQPVPVEDPALEGRVTVALDGEPLARGFVREGVLAHEVPKGRLRWLKAAITQRVAVESNEGGGGGMSPQAMMVYSITVQILGVLAIVCVAGAVLGIPTALAASGGERLSKVFRSRREPMVWAAIIATTAMLGSLYLSEIVGFAPCRLCWFQRFAMYPMVPILGVLAWRGETRAWWVGVVFAGIGLAISALHIYEQLNPEGGFAPCGTGVPCSARYVAVFGFISIPVLAGAAFLAIITLMLATRALHRTTASDDASA